jgi:type I restriction enzyme, R subunit
VIIDEAHSSQSGEGTKHLNTVLSAGSLEEAEAEDGSRRRTWRTGSSAR